jgi:hypothetical protein
MDIDHWDVEDEDWLYSVYALIAEEQEDVNRKYIESFLCLIGSSFVTL